MHLFKALYADIFCECTLVGMLDEVSCPKKNGRFATSQCDAYVECVDGVGTYKLCPDGLLFDENAHLYGYPCGYPIDIDCTGRTDLRKCSLFSFQ